MTFSLSPQDQDALAAKVAAARETHAQHVLRTNEASGKKDISKAEYLQRAEAEAVRVRAAAKAVQGTRIAKAQREWGKIVGPTFAGAKSDIPQIEERVQRHLRKQGLHKTSLVFHGSELGRGKTWSAYSYLNRLIETGTMLPGQIYSGTESSTVGEVANSGFERSAMLASMRHPRNKVYFIDDVGIGYFFKQEHRHEVWYELINHVYNRHLTLIMTTNLPFTLQGLGQWLGPRAFDRLQSLIGYDGSILMSGVNKREAVFNENESKYKRR